MDNNSILTRRVAEIIDRRHLEEMLRSDRKLRVKLGIDPNRRELHLGHAVPLRKLREFQEAGHKAIFIIGDWTALIGDPSGKDETRPALSEQEVRRNAAHFTKQAFLILDKQKTEVRLQSEWFRGFGLKEVIKLSSLVTEKQILAHETFRQRIEKDLPFYHHETIYPLLQGYDSVAVKADVELGALEQKFNLLMGRTIQRAFGQKPQGVLMVPYLFGLDGREKMSKSLSNFIALSDSAQEMFGKVMSIPDNLITHYFELCTDVAEKEIVEMKKALERRAVNPRDIKSRLALEITKLYHGAKSAASASLAFEQKFGKAKDLSRVKADLELKKKPGEYILVQLLVEGKLASSKSEARRKIQEGAVVLDGKKVTSDQVKVKIAKGILIRLGKRFLRIS